MSLKKLMAIDLVQRFGVFLMLGAVFVAIGGGAFWIGKWIYLNKSLLSFGLYCGFTVGALFTLFGSIFLKKDGEDKFDEMASVLERWMRDRGMVMRKGSRKGKYWVKLDGNWCMIKLYQVEAGEAEEDIEEGKDLVVVG